MAGPVFTDAAYLPLVEASHDAFVPGLDSIPADSVTLVQTNPTFIAAYLAGLNSALGHELLWRGYPTDERGTYWHSFWGAGAGDRATAPVQRLSGRQRRRERAAAARPGAPRSAAAPLPGQRHLRRARRHRRGLPELDDGTKIVRPLFRNFVDPDITLVGFPLTYDEVTGTAAVRATGSSSPSI